MSSPFLGVVADDLTGATDVGSMSAKAGFLTHVYAYDRYRGGGTSPVRVFDTDSRFDDAATAYAKVFEATRALRVAGCQRFHKKTCSVFRGNVGAEFDAMLDALGEEFAVVALGFPRNGRTTVDGVHYVHGIPLELTPFRHDPVHPMTSSNLVEILGAQTSRAVTSLGHQVVARGERELAQAFADARRRGGYLIVDVVEQAALATIAAAVLRSKVRVLCGASALVEDLAQRWPRPADPSAATRLESAVNGPAGVLVIAGSLTPQTLEQLALARSRGMRTLTFDTAALFSAEGSDRAISALADAAASALRSAQSVIVQADNRPEAVIATQAAGAKSGNDRAATGRLVSAALAEIAQLCRQQAGLTRLVVAGGDTSAAVCRALGVDGLRVLSEVGPGVPACEALCGGPLVCVLKSGSFGGERFLLDAVAHLMEVDSCTR